MPLVTRTFVMRYKVYRGDNHGSHFLLIIKTQ